MPDTAEHISKSCYIGELALMSILTTWAIRSSNNMFHRHSYSGSSSYLYPVATEVLVHGTNSLNEITKVDNVML